jgi:hypothetical protein
MTWYVLIFAIRASLSGSSWWCEIAWCGSEIPRFTYAWSRDQLLEDWQKVAAACIDVAAISSSAPNAHEGPRWWEDYRVSCRE